MAAERENTETQAGRDDARAAGDRRGADRRRVERRAPPPVWRRPWALVSYGVLGALAAVLLVSGLSGDDEEDLPDEVVTAPPAQPPTAEPSPQAAAAPPVEAFGAADFERLVIEGEAARGRRVRAQLYCDAPSPVALRPSAPRVESAVAELADAEGRVVGAACKWGARDDERRQDFLLLVPPALADEFAAAPVATDDFVRRRRILAEVEWVGRSDALALRTAGVLRRVLRS